MAKPPIIVPGSLPLTNAGGTPSEVFVGRANELSILKEALLNRNTQVAYVVGAYGMGKTALVREFCRQAADSFPGGIEFVYGYANSAPTSFALRYPTVHSGF